MDGSAASRVQPHSWGFHGDSQRTLASGEAVATVKVEVPCPRMSLVAVPPEAKDLRLTPG